MRPTKKKIAGTMKEPITVINGYIDGFEALMIPPIPSKLAKIKQMIAPIFMKISADKTFFGQRFIWQVTSIRDTD